MIVVIGLALVSLAGFFVYFWWTAPIYDSSLVRLTEVAINGTVIGSSPIEMTAGRTYEFSAQAAALGQSFVVVDSGDEPYQESVPWNAKTAHVVPDGQIDPTFFVVFGTDLLLGRARPGIPVSITQIKTAPDGKTARIQTKVGAPSKPGTYWIELFRVDNPDGWVQMRPNVWVHRKFKHDVILWRHRVRVIAKK